MTSATYISNRIYSTLLTALLIIFGTAGSILAAEDSDTVEVSLITCSPGQDIYELEGHAALRVRQGDRDWAGDYGIFDFNSPNFVYRFVSGQTDYIVAAYPFNFFLSQYVEQGRSVTEHKLNISQEQAIKLVGLLQDNLRPENRTYRYNYVKDNCSTRPLSIIERAIDDSIRFNRPPQSHVPATFRDAMRRHHILYPWYQFGIDIALGSGIDYPISRREMTFAPTLLAEMLPDAVISGPAGQDKPLVKETVTIMPADASRPKVGPTPWYLTPMAVAMMILIATIAVVIRDIRRGKVTKWWDCALFALQGLAGILVAFLIFVSVHEATSPNWLLLWLNPLCLIVPACIYIKKCKGLVFCYEIANFVALFILSVIWPWLNQSGNFAFIPLVLADALLSGRYVYVTYAQKKRPQYNR